MKVKFCLIISLVLICILSSVAVGQTKPDQVKQRDLLPPVPSEPINCSLFLNYFDDALTKAYLSKSNLILIIKMTNVKNRSLAQTRLKHLKNYMLFRDFRNFAVGVDLDKNATDLVDFYIKGELIYSLQIERNDKLDQFGHC